VRSEQKHGAGYSAPMARVLSKVRAGAVLAAAVAVALALGACAPSPTSTYVNASGEEVTVNWADYPGHAYYDADEVLKAPPAEDIETVSSAVIGEIEQRLTAEFALAWEDGPDGDQFHPLKGNGYGGPSLYVTFNSVSRESLGIPRSSAEWRRILDVVNDVLASHGFGDVQLEFTDRDESSEEGGRSNSDEHWQWAGMAHHNSEWVMVSLMDVDRDTSGEAMKEMKGSIEYGWNPRSVNILYGATTLSAASRAEFLNSALPFTGLARPDATTSD
jgi:hypothetical protein